MKIYFVIAALGPGGAERVASILSNNWTSIGHEVTIITFDNPDSPSHYMLNPLIKLIQLNLLSLDHSLPMLITENVRRIWKLRREFSKASPDIIISFMTTANILAVLARFNLRIPLVISERVHPGYHDMGLLRSFLRARLYKYADKIIVQTNDIADWMRLKLGVNADVIANPLELDYFDQVTEKNNDIQKGSDKYFVSVGRLDRQKGHDITISAFASISAKYPGWKLLIYGDGPEKINLHELVRTNNLQDKVILKGVVTDIRNALHLTDIFILASRYEGFPNALLEALACGRCVIASDCHGASNAILQGGQYGKLVEPENIGELSQAMEALITNEQMRQDYALHAREAVPGFSAEVIARQWLDMFTSLRA